MVTRALALLALALGAAAGPAAAAPTTERVSYDLGGSQWTYPSFDPAISAHGDVVAYVVDHGDELDPKRDVYAYDRSSDKTEWISAAPLGVPGNGSSERPAISPDGRYVAFRSSSSNLVSGDSDGVDIFVRDRETGAIERVHDPRTTHGNCDEPTFSSGDRYLAFACGAPRDALGGQLRNDVLLHDRTTGKTTVVSPTGHNAYTNSFGPSVSSGGRFVAFVFGERVAVRDRKLKRTEQFGGHAGYATETAMSASGRVVAFTMHTRNDAGDDTALRAGDVFARDRKTGHTKLLSLDRTGHRANDASGGVAISPGGRYVGFASRASDLVAHDTNDAGDIFVRDRGNGTTRRVSVSASGHQAKGESGVIYIGFSSVEFDAPSISAGGSFVAFSSRAENLVPSDTNKESDVFVRGPLGG